MIFRCLGVDGEPIEIQDPERSLSFAIIASKRLLAVSAGSNPFLYTGRVTEIENPDSPKYGRSFMLRETLQLEGTFSLSVHHQTRLMSAGRVVFQSWDGISVTTGACPHSSQHRCPQHPQICSGPINEESKQVRSPLECDMITKECLRKDENKPFRCGVGADAAQWPCVASSTECCKDGQRWCESQRKCVEPPYDACCELQTPPRIHCRTKSTLAGGAVCVKSQYECCSDLNVTNTNNNTDSEGHIRGG
jgi:hypothetical protein